MGRKSRLKREKRLKKLAKQGNLKRKGHIAQKAELVGRFTGYKRTAIVGIGVGHEMAPEKGEVWCMNDLGTLRYTTMIWDMHDFEWSDEQAWDQLKELHKEAMPDEDILDRMNARKGRFKRISDFCKQTGMLVACSTRWRFDSTHARYRSRLS